MRAIQAIDLWNGPYLAHYGVKGMKWGIRKDALKKRIMYGKSVKDLDRMYRKSNFKGKYDEYDENVLAIRDIKRNLYATNVSLGQAFLRRIMYGRKASQNYNKLKASARSEYDLYNIKSDMHKPVSEVANTEITRAAYEINDDILKRTVIPYDEPEEWKRGFKRGSKIQYGKKLDFDKTWDHVYRSKWITRK